MASDELSKLLNEAFLAARAGKKADARRMLEQILEQDDSNEQAWLVLASVVDTPRERRICLENVLEINPNNEKARQALERLRPPPSSSGVATQPSGPAPAPKAAQPTSPPAAPIRPAASAAQRQQPVKLPTKRAGETTRGTADAWQSQRVHRGVNPTFLLIALGGITVIFIGLFLASGGLTDQEPTSIPETLILGGSTQLAVQPTAMGPTLSPTPLGTIVTPPPISPGEIPSTWTPIPTVTPLPSPTPTATMPPLSIYNLVFVGEGRGRKSPAVYTIQGDGGDEKLLLDTGGKVADPAWSPDGTKLAYIGLVDGRDQLIVADAAGANPKILTRFTQGQNVRTPSWSPDSKQIVFVSDDTGNDELYLIDVDGQNQRRLTDNRYSDLEPAFSPDGKQIAYASDAATRGVFQIYVRPVDMQESERPTQLTETPENRSPAWSPDGQYIAFISTRNRLIPKVYVMRKDGADERLITFDDGDAANSSPTWSPDGKYIAFVSNRNKIDAVYITTVDGRNVQPVTKSDEGSGKSITPKFKPGS